MHSWLLYHIFKKIIVKHQPLGGARTCIFSYQLSHGLPLLPQVFIWDILPNHLSLISGQHVHLVRWVEIIYWIHQPLKLQASDSQIILWRIPLLFYGLLNTICFSMVLILHCHSDWFFWQILINISWHSPLYPLLNQNIDDYKITWELQVCQMPQQLDINSRLSLHKLHNDFRSYKK